MEKKMEDPDFYKKIHSFDQASASFGAIATILSAYFDALLKTNFTRKESFQLVKMYQKNLLKLQLEMMIDLNAKSKNNEDEENDGGDDEYFGN